jgi:hypothetical protein
MAYTPKPGSMSLFKNDRKEKDTHPDYKGDGADLEGRPVWISAWLKETNDGKKFFSISLKLKDQPREDSFRGGASDSVSRRNDPVSRPGSFDADLDDSIPF